MAIQHGVETVADQLSDARVFRSDQIGSRMPLPDITIDVDDFDEVYRRAKAGTFEIRYDLTDEHWGDRRYSVRDPFGKLVNTLSHPSQASVWRYGLRPIGRRAIIPPRRTASRRQDSELLCWRMQ